MRTPRLLSGAPLVAIPIVTTLGSVAPVQAATDPGTTPAWTVPVKLDSGGAEPSIRVAPDGRSAAYVSAPSGLGSNFWPIDESVDSGGFTHLTPAKGVQPDMGTGGGDAEISVGQPIDPGTGCAPIAYSGLHNIDLLDNFTVAKSTDCGKTFSLLNPYATQNALTDRQWQTFDGRLTNHLQDHEVDTGQIVDSVSYDGGDHYVTLGTATGASGVVDTAHAFTLQNVKIGNVVTSKHLTGANNPISGELEHTLWATFAGSRDAMDPVAGANGSGGYDHLDTIYVARSDDGGLTWTDTASFSTGANETRELDLIFPVIALDSAGNLYSAWTDGNLIQYVSSSDDGKTWSGVHTVNPGEAGAKAVGGTADLFPWIAGGGPGRLDVVWCHGEGGNRPATAMSVTVGRSGRWPSVSWSTPTRPPRPSCRRTLRSPLSCTRGTSATTGRPVASPTPATGRCSTSSRWRLTPRAAPTWPTPRIRGPRRRRTSSTSGRTPAPASSTAVPSRRVVSVSTRWPSARRTAPSSTRRGTRPVLSRWIPVRRRPRPTSMSPGPS
jgi:hypothetical protein